MTEGTELNELARHVWASKYRYRGPEGPEASIAETFERVATAIAGVERAETARWAERFLAALSATAFLPAGRILAGAGTSRNVTLFNCFVMDFIDDSVDAIFEQLKRSALTMQWGGGIGCDFSTLRPRGSQAVHRGTIASGPVSFMRVWDAMCATLLSTGARRGAMMGTLRCDHPDIEEFVDAKRTAGVLTNFNLSVQVTDAFMAALAGGADWPLCFPSDAPSTAAAQRRLRWPGAAGEVACEIVRRVPAAELWRRIMSAAYECAEPGVLFVDRINALNNLYYCEHITSTNPCGEIPLPANGACNLGSLNLCAFVREPFSRRATLDLEALERTARLGTRMLDDVIDLSQFPLPEQARQARATRRIGLGITGLGDALIMLGLGYDSDSGRRVAREALERIRDAAYLESVVLAEERGSFGLFERDPFLAGAYAGTLPDEIRDSIARSGLRNSHLIAIAPTGTISLLANNVSSGIEPVYALEGERRVLNEHGVAEAHRSVDFAYAMWRESGGGALPESFVTAADLTPDAHLQMLGALQPLVDNSISKTINADERISFEDFAGVYARAYALGLKGCTVFRPNPVRGSVLSELPAPGRVQCCSVDREGD